MSRKTGYIYRGGDERIKVFVLAGGRGSRMSMNTMLPKSFLSVTRNETIISRQMRQLRWMKINMDDITIVASTHTLPFFIRDGPKVKYANVIGAGMGDVLTKMSHMLTSEETIILHGDVIMDDMTLDEILTEGFTDIAFIGDVARTEIFGILLKDKGHLILKNLPDIVNGTPRKNCMIFDIQAHCGGKYFCPLWWITDVDYPTEYIRVLRYMREHRL